MEKYGQYRDKGSGIAPFFPTTPPPSTPLLLPWHAFLFCIRIPILIFAWLVWLCIIQWLPVGSVLRKANQWCLLGIPGVWWIDLQVDGVRRGSLAQTPRGRLPYPGTVIACTYTSPLDVLYLAAIFDPIFTRSSRNKKAVRPITQESALADCFSVINPFTLVGGEQDTVSLDKLVKQNPKRIIVVFPETTISNGRGVLRLSPSLLSAASDTKVFPVSLRYTPPDVVTPIPGWLEALRFIWRLNSRQTHCIRVRIGGARTMAPAPTFNSSTPDPSMTSAQIKAAADRASLARRRSYKSNFFDTLQSSPAQKVAGESESESGADEVDQITDAERKALDAVADDLARLGRIKRVDLSVREKEQFIAAWFKRSKSRK